LECPECRSKNISWEENTRKREPGITVLEYVCQDCGCEFDEIEKIKIIKHGNPIPSEGNKRR